MAVTKIVNGLRHKLLAGPGSAAKQNGQTGVNHSGDYVVTPAHLRGERPLEFIGRDPAYRP